MRRSLAAILLLLAATVAHGGVFNTGSPSTTNNDDSCDIALLPAATLLLPYFEVDLAAASGQGETTLFTVTNVTNEAQAVAITLWTDLSFPVVTMHVYLTGYDTQSINLYDVIRQGVLAPPRGTSASTDQGDFSIENPDLDVDNCFNLPGAIPAAFVTRIRSALTQGTVPALGNLPACHAIGNAHTRASGYVTIDVVGSCNFTQPDDPSFAGQLRFDNVLVGDYQQVNGAQGSAQGGPLVHIRAVPEGVATASNLPRTFYSRFMPATNVNYDRRQPLPSVYAAHWIDGGPGAFSTDFKIWREAATGTGASCSDYPNRNNDIPLVEIAVFDEEENGVGITRFDGICDPPPCPNPSLASGRYDLEEEFPLPGHDTNAGWIYLNLDNPDRAGAQQAWVIASLRAENRYSADVDALALGNGCSASEPVSIVASDASGTFIGPLPNVNP